MPEPSLKKDRWSRLLVASWALIGLGVLVVAVLYLLGKIAGALVPFLFAVVMLYVFRTPVAWLERHRWQRGYAVLACYLVMLGVLVGAGLFIVPPILNQVRDFVSAFPHYYDSVYKVWLSLQERYQALTLPAWVDQSMLGLRDSVTKQFSAWSGALAKEVFTVGSQAATSLVSALLTLVIGFWLLKDYPTVRREILALAGKRRREDAIAVASRVSRALSGYLRGQFFVSLSTAVFVAVGLSILKVPYAFVLGLLAGALNIVPYLGPFIAELLSAIVGAFVSPWLALGAVLVVVAAQQMTDLFVTPRVMSRQVDLHPLLVILSLLVGAAVGGVVGMILAIPVAAIVKAVFVYFFEKYSDSTLTTKEGALFREQAHAPEAKDTSGKKRHDADDQKEQA